MSLPTSAGAPGRGRSAPQSGAAAVLVVMALGGLVAALVGLVLSARVVDHVRAVGRGLGAVPAEVNPVVLLVWAGAAVTLAVGLVWAALLIGLAIGVLHGLRVARGATWVVCAFGALGGVGAAAVTVAQRLLRWPAPDDLVQAELLAALSEGYPSWWFWLSGGLSVAQVLGYLVVALLLALSRARASPGSPATVPGAPPVPSSTPR